ncbi:MAG: PilN domain-containing protein [Armatimonadota bacterium]|nr:PilN domain-containing protein [Armatimonadota bacterium]
MTSHEFTTMTGFEALPRVDLGRARRAERVGILGRSRRQLAALTALLILGPCLLLPSTRQVFDLRAQGRETDRQLTAVTAQRQRVTQSDDRTETRIAVWTRFQQSRDSRHAWDDALPALAAALPAEVALQRAQITGSDGSAQFAAEGTAETMSALRAFLRTLAASPSFAHVRLEETTANPSAGPHGVSFKISGPMTL